MIVKYKEICIRGATIYDSEQLEKWWNDGKVMAHAGFPLGLHTTAFQIEEEIKMQEERQSYRHIIEYQNMPIGEMNYHIRGSNKVEIGIKICDEAYQNRGLGRVILSMFIEQLFLEGYKTIILDTNLNNLRARHVYELLGFKNVGVHIDNWKDQLGNLQSTVDYELKEEYFHSQIKKDD